MLPETPADLHRWPSPPGGWPAGVWDVPYDSRSVPGAPSPPSWLHGANCQRHAYGILELFGRRCAALRSSELWNDPATSTDDGPQPLDLMMFNATEEPFGAHVGIWMAPNSVLHLCKEIGQPTSRTLAEFATRARYATLLGFKRVAVRA